MAEAEETHYDVLGVNPNASKTEIRNAYRECLGAAQADGDVQRVNEIRRAWQVLSDPFQRQRYDDAIGVDRRAPSTNGTGSAGSEVVEAEVVDEDEEAGQELEPSSERRSAPRGAIPPPLAPGLEIPRLGRRFAAALIDVVTMVAVYAAVVGLVVGAGGIDSGIPLAVTVIATAEFLVLAYLVIPTMRTGQTLGKRMTYIMVVDRATGTLPPPNRVFMRYVIPMAIVLVLYQQGAIVALFLGLSWLMSKDQISLLDRFAKTAVVIARYRPERARPR